MCQESCESRGRTPFPLTKSFKKFFFASQCNELLLFHALRSHAPCCRSHVCRALHLKRRIDRLACIHAPLLSSAAAVGILRFRWWHAAAGSIPPEETPDTVRPVVIGDQVELRIAGMLPRTVCFLHLDVEVFALRWGRRQSLVSLHQVDSFGWPTADHVSCSQPGQTAKAGALPSTALHIAFSDVGGVMRTLELHTSSNKAKAWSEGLEVFLQTVPRSASPAHSRWVLSCMAVTSRRGQGGFLRKSEIRLLVRCANGSPDLPSEAFDNVFRAVEESEQALPLWLKPLDASSRSRELNARQ
eukprot:5369354-Prymnesium_polylepis.1